MPALLDQALTMPGELNGIYTRFYNYSTRNQALMYMQGLEEPVASYKRWQDLGRQVIKGSTAAYILRPITVKSRDELDDQGQPKQYTKFKLIKSVFGVSQTEGEDLPEYEPPEWDRDHALGALAINLVPFQLLDGNVQAYAYERNVAVSPVAEYPLKSLLHECGHILCGHTSPEQQDEYKLHRGTKEFQAEGTAYLAIHSIGAATQFDASASRAYIQHYLRGERPSDKAISQVFSATDKLVTAGRKEVAGTGNVNQTALK